MDEYLSRWEAAMKKLLLTGVSALSVLRTYLKTASPLYVTPGPHRCWSPRASFWQVVGFSAGGDGGRRSPKLPAIEGNPCDL
jgi:hypothetical protein